MATACPTANLLINDARHLSGKAANVSFNYRYSGAGAGCGYCKRRFWPSPTQQRKRIVPIHDMPGGVCDGSLTTTVDF